MKMNKKKKIIISILSIVIVISGIIGGGLFYLRHKYGVDEVSGSNVKVFTNEDDFEKFKEEQEENGNKIIMDDN
ncbi:hypothetical protein ACYSNW_13455 [Enterococcus sp. LJL99]